MSDYLRTTEFHVSGNRSELVLNTIDQITGGLLNQLVLNPIEPCFVLLNACFRCFRCVCNASECCNIMLGSLNVLLSFQILWQNEKPKPNE